MPQASTELRAEMKRLFGQGIDDSGPTKFLEAAGYVLTPEWLWKPKPGVVTYADMMEDEWLCLRFLIDEWDFGGLEGAAK